ncbi:MAG: protein-glutamate O-methyltransferase CheR [Thiomargarita sp.]|nr:protein-glutamate O-methyltransferase CheR [Thiomargarita sp.]
MENSETEKLEIDLLLNAIEKCYGYDFHHYARDSFTRRVKNFLQKSNYHQISELIPQILHDKDYFKSFLLNLSVTVTELFRDPFFYKAIRKEVIPYLKTYPFIKIWHAGCATGEEVYSMAILLKEEGIYHRSQIYATDFNDLALDKAKKGIYPIEQVMKETVNYQEAGGKKSFSDHYHSDNHYVIMNRELKKNITFANHNLVTDACFGEMHLILCRNVLIYFDEILQNRALKLFDESLIYKGYLCLGTKETLMFTNINEHFERIAHQEKIYQKIMVNY